MNGVAFSHSQRRRFSQKTHAEATQTNILKGMVKIMPPLQAMVFMSYFNQFPERYSGIRNDYYFQPDWVTTIRQLHLSRRVFWKMTRALVGLGYLQRRWCGLLRGWWEYQIAFEKLKRFSESTT